MQAKPKNLKFIPFLLGAGLLLAAAPASAESYPTAQGYNHSNVSTSRDISPTYATSPKIKEDPSYYSNAGQGGVASGYQTRPSRSVRHKAVDYTRFSETNKFQKEDLKAETFYAPKDYSYRGAKTQ